jgi:hypothetical protein
MKRPLKKRLYNFGTILVISLALFVVYWGLRIVVFLFNQRLFAR